MTRTKQNLIHLHVFGNLAEVNQFKMYFVLNNLKYIINQRTKFYVKEKID